MLPIWGLLSMKFAVLVSFVYHSIFLCSRGIGSKRHFEIESEERPHFIPTLSETNWPLSARSVNLWVFVSFVRNWRQYFESGCPLTICVQPRSRSGQSIEWVKYSASASSLWTATFPLLPYSCNYCVDLNSFANLAQQQLAANAFQRCSANSPYFTFGQIMPTRSSPLLPIWCLFWLIDYFQEAESWLFCERDKVCGPNAPQARSQPSIWPV